MHRVRPYHLLPFAWIATPGEYWQSADNVRWLRASQHLLQSFAACGGVRIVMAGTCAEYDWSRAARRRAVSSHDAAWRMRTEGVPRTITPSSKIPIAFGACLRFTARQKISAPLGWCSFGLGPRPNIRSAWSRQAIRSPAASRERRWHCAAEQSGAGVLAREEDLAEAFAQPLHSAVEGPVNIGS